MGKRLLVTGCGGFVGGTARAGNAPAAVALKFRNPMNTCHICSTPVEDDEETSVCAGCGEIACSNCNVGGLCLDCMSRLDLLSFWEERK